MDTVQRVTSPQLVKDEGDRPISANPLLFLFFSYTGECQLLESTGCPSITCGLSVLIRDVADIRGVSQLFLYYICINEEGTHLRALHVRAQSALAFPMLCLYE